MHVTTEFGRLSPWLENLNPLMNFHSLGQSQMSTLAGVVDFHITCRKLSASAMIVSIS